MRNVPFEERVSEINLTGKLSWMNTEIGNPYDNDGYEVIDPNVLLNKEDAYLLMPRHMSFMENNEYKPDGESITYGSRVDKLFDTFYDGNLSVDDMLNELKTVNRLYDIERLINETNEKWINSN